MLKNYKFKDATLTAPLHLNEDPWSSCVTFSVNGHRFTLQREDAVAIAASFSVTQSQIDTYKYECQRDKEDES